MKRTLYFCFCLFFLQAGFAQEQLTAADWQADLRFLQQTVHDDYPFLFKKVTAEKFDAEVEKFHRGIPQMADHEILAGFSRIVALFGYGHTDIGWYGGPVNYHRSRFNLYYFSDGLYVQGVHQDHRDALGARVTAVEGMPVDKALQAIRPLVPAENDQYFKAFGINLLAIPEALHAQGVTKELKTTVTLSLEKDGRAFEYSFPAPEATRLPVHYSLMPQEGEWLDARDQSQTPLYLQELDRISFFQYLPEQRTVYVRQSQIQDDPQEAIPDFYARVFDFIEKNEVEKLVLDLRLNGGGNNYKNKPIVTGIIRTEKIDQAGKLFVIIGRRTFSACQNLVNELDNYTNAIFVGEPTAENINFYGDNNRVELPHSKLAVYLSFAWWQDKPQWENADWLAPHLAAEMSFDDYRSNRDPVLQAALEFADDNFLLDPLAYLRGLFETGQVELLKSESVRLVRDPKYRFVDFEDQINQAGYQLLNGNRIQEAMFVFGLNTELFPGSANAWDSYGEVHWKAGQKEKAVEYYRKAISLDPDGPIGENARKMLKEMEK